jgi:hypothetical protein
MLSFRNHPWLVDKDYSERLCKNDYAVILFVYTVITVYIILSIGILVEQGFSNIGSVLIAIGGLGLIVAVVTALVSCALHVCIDNDD